MASITQMIHGVKRVSVGPIRRVKCTVFQKRMYDVRTVQIFFAGDSVMGLDLFSEDVPADLLSCLAICADNAVKPDDDQGDDDQDDQDDQDDDESRCRAIGAIPADHVS